MNYTDDKGKNPEKFNILNYLPNIGIDNVKEEIFEGLRANPKYISPKFFYDGEGSELFEEITHLEEYYPTRTEKGIISSELFNLDIDFRNLNIVELGSGDASKISLLLEQLPNYVLETINYFPIDISQPAIEKSSIELSKKFSLNSITGVVVDFFYQMDLIPKTGKRLFCFFGSTIGNFNKEQAMSFIKLLGKSMQKDDMLLLGMDLVKDISVLEAAYNDKKGVTAKFNKNILTVVNNLTRTDFNEADFEHYAFFNKNYNRIEMHLKALVDVEVKSKIGSETFSIKKGEIIHTENSYKFTDSDIDTIAIWADINIIKVLKDENNWFSLSYFVK